MRQTTFPSRNRPYGPVQFRPANIWTQNFFCLGKPTDCTTADRGYKSLLDSVNLGSRKIKFDNKEGNHEYFLEVLEQEFPLLKSQNGAVMLWRCNIGGNNNRPLQKFLPGPDGYSVPYLHSKILSGCIYITPMQSSLMSNCEIASGSGDMTNVDNAPPPSLPHAQCMICKQQILLKEFADHLMQCSTRMLNEDREESASNIENSIPVDVEQKVDKKQLKAMFPDISEFRIENVLTQSANLDEAIETLLSGNNKFNCGKKYNDLKSLKEDFSKQTMQNGLESIQVDRRQLWRSVLLFYKKALLDRNKLTKELAVQFSKVSIYVYHFCCCCKYSFPGFVQSGYFQGKC